MGDKNQRSKLVVVAIILLAMCAIVWGLVIAYQLGMARNRPQYSQQERAESQQAYMVNFWIKDDYRESGECSLGKPDITEQNGLLRLTFNSPDGTQIAFANVERYSMHPNESCKRRIESLIPQKERDEMKPYAVCCLLFVVCFFALPCYALDGTWLLDRCADVEKTDANADFSGYNACANYIAGVLDENDFWYAVLDGEGNHSHDKGKICPWSDKGIDTQQGVRIVQKYLRDNPDKLHWPAAVLVTNAIHAAFPCQANQQKRRP